MAESVIGIIMGSKSDKEIMDRAAAILDELQIPHDIEVCSAHRNPGRTAEYAREAEGRGIKVIIAGAGLAAALPGVLAAHTHLPVIGVPINAENSLINGMDAVGGILQMPPGVPVACVGINNARNAGLLAAAIIALSDAEVKERLIAYRQKLSQ